MGQTESDPLPKDRNTDFKRNELRKIGISIFIYFFQNFI